MVDEYSASSLLSDRARGLVGGLKTKLDDKDEDTEVVLEGFCSFPGDLGPERESGWKEVKSRGGEADSHDLVVVLYKASSDSTPEPP